MASLTFLLIVAGLSPHQQALIDRVRDGDQAAADALVGEICALEGEPRRRSAARAIGDLKDRDIAAARRTIAEIRDCLPRQQSSIEDRRSAAKDKAIVQAEPGGDAVRPAAEGKSELEPWRLPVAILAFASGGLGGAFAVASYLGVVLGHAIPGATTTPIAMLPIIGGAIVSRLDETMNAISLLSTAGQLAGLTLLGVGLAGGLLVLNPQWLERE